MYRRAIYTLTQSLLIATTLSVGMTVSACSAEPVRTFESIELSNPKQTYQLGLAYYEGDSVPEDNDKAFKLFQQAADQGYAPAERYLGLMYYHGNIEQNYQKAFLWIQKAANQGYTDAQTDLGIMYEDGAGVNQDYEKARRLG